MTEFCKFASENPVLTFCLGVLVAITFETFFSTCVRITYIIKTKNKVE